MGTCDDEPTLKTLLFERLKHSCNAWRSHRALTIPRCTKKVDHVDLMPMTEAESIPEARIDHVERLSKEEKSALEGREPMPEFLSTPPL